MKSFVTIAALLQVAFGGFVSVRMPYANPAGVTYVNGGYQGHEYPLTYAASPAPYAQSYAQPQPLQYHYQYQHPLRYPAKIEAHHVGYAAAQVPAVAAVPFVKHIPTVSHVPVTRYEAQHAVIEKQVDVAKPAVSTRKYEVRRPAIQKQFYDIEERVIVRPAGSAVVELDEPTSKLQRGPAVVHSLDASHYSAVSPVTHNLVGQAASFSHGPSSVSSVPFIAHAPVHVTVAPVISHAPTQNFQYPSSTPAPTVNENPSQGESSADEQSVVVENADFRSQFKQSVFRAAGQNDNVASKGQENAQQQYFQSLRNSQVNTKQSQIPSIDIKPNGFDASSPAFRGQDSSPSVIPSVRGSAEESRSNQERFIDLLTARGGITEVGFGRDGGSAPVGDAGHVRARVISATPAPEYAEPAGERVSTRRVVVSRPIETLQEVDVVEPATKYERISVQHPTLIKTARLDHIQVHGSVPVVGKAYAPAVAHAAVPVYQKTISHSYGF